MRVYSPHRDAQGTRGVGAWAGHPGRGWVHYARGCVRRRVENWRGTAWIGALRASVLHCVRAMWVVGAGAHGPKARLLDRLLGKSSFSEPPPVQFTAPFHFGAFIPLGINHLGFLRGAS